MDLAGTPEIVELSPAHSLRVLSLPPPLLPSAGALSELWDLHPADHHTIHMGGRPVQTPRWQQAYGADYHYTGRVNRALPVPAALSPILAWARGVDPRLNGLLLNWYDSERGHYIGKHRDSTIGLIQGCPIVTISLGARRVFRLRPWRAPAGSRRRVDVPVAHGTVIVMSYATNLAWTHEVPFRKSRDRGRRISVTVRGFLRGLSTDAPGTSPSE